MNNNRRGKAVIINNVDFIAVNSRTGSTKDSTALSHCLSRLGFQINLHQDQTRQQTIDTLERVAHEDHTDADCLIVSMMSHGGKDVICAADYDPSRGTGLLTLDDITDPFKGDNCPSLAGKPKIFIINACRGDQIDLGVEELDHVDSIKSSNKVPVQADFFIFYSCSEGYTSIREESTGSYFIQDFCRVFNEYGRLLHLGELALQVKQIVASRLLLIEDCSDREMQMPVTVDTLRKLVFFT